MPIRLNLLSEAQAAEELRRRDPVKRVTWIAGLLVASMLVWSSMLQVGAMYGRRNLVRMEEQVASQTNIYQSVLENQRQAADTDHRLKALHQLATNRFLNGSLLNALQQTTVEGIELVHLKVDQNYAYTEEVKSKTTGGRTTPGKPATAIERIVITLDAKDLSANPGDKIGSFKETVATNQFFATLLGKTNEVRLTRLSPPQSLPGQTPFVSFTVECRLPEVAR